MGAKTKAQQPINPNVDTGHPDSSLRLNVNVTQPLCSLQTTDFFGMLEKVRDMTGVEVCF